MRGNGDAQAKTVATELIAQLRWEPLDVGCLEQALHLEHMMLLRVRLVRVHGHLPNTEWAHFQR